MDAYEATKMVFSRIQALDPDNAATVMGVLLIQDPGEQEMIRLAFGPDSLLRAVINESLNKHHHQNQGGPLSATPAGQPPPFFSAPSPPPPPDFDDDPLLMCSGGLHNAVVGPRGGPMMSPALPAGDHTGGRCLYFSRGYCKNGPACRFFHHHHHHAYGPPPMMRTAAAAGGGGTVNYNETEDDDYYGTHPSTLLGSSPRLLSPSITNQQLNPPSPLAAAPSPKSSLTTINHLLRLQQLHYHQRRLIQRAEDEDAAAAAATTLRLLNMRAQYPSPPSPDMLSPASRQIYLTFPADSTFTEEDVSNYFTIYGPVQDVRIPYQQKRMFGFVSFVYPETVRMVLAKGNPHFVCDSRVLVKPYKEKPKLRDTNRKPLMSTMSERSDFSAAAMDDSAYHHQIGFHPLEGSRMLLSGGQEAATAAALLRRKMMEEDHQHQQAAANVTALHQAIELQRKRFAGLQMLDINNHHHRDAPPPGAGQPLSSLSPTTNFTSPTAFTSSTVSGVTHATAATTGHHQLTCNGTEQGKCFLSGSDDFAPEPPLTNLTAEQTVAAPDNEVDDSDIDKETPETWDTEQDTKRIIGSSTTTSEAAAAHGRIPGLSEAEGRAMQDTCSIQGSEQRPPESLPSPAKCTLIHNPPSATSEELELPNPIFPAPWLLSSPASRCQVGRGAVGM